PREHGGLRGRLLPASGTRPVARGPSLVRRAAGAALKTFTVAVPTYNREKDLGDCLESILGQSLLPDEVLVIDDAALPAGFIARWKGRFAERRVALVYYKKDHEVERRGLSESKNAALRIAKG